MCSCGFCRGFNINLPSDKLLQNLPTLNIHIGEKFSATPIPKAKTISIDGSGKTGKAAITWKEGNKWKHFLSGGHSSTQGAGISGAILALQHWPKEPLNLVCDSGYTVYTLLHIDQALLKGFIEPQLLSPFLMLESLLDKRKHPLFATHI